MRKGKKMALWASQGVVFQGKGSWPKIEELNKKVIKMGKKLWEWIKKVWKKNKDFIILGFLGILALVLVLIFLWPEKDKIIQSELIVILVCVTGYYATQTQKLVTQEKRSLEEEQKKRNADFEEKKLKEFYVPLKYMLFDLKAKVSDESYPLKPTIVMRVKIAGLGSNFGHMITKRLEDEILELLGILNEIKNIKKEDEKKLKAWKEKTIVKIEKVKKQKDKEVNIIRSIIKETYGLFSERLENILTRKEENES